MAAPTELAPLAKARRYLVPLLCLCFLERCNHYLNLSHAITIQSSPSGEQTCNLLDPGTNASSLDLSHDWRRQLLRSAAFLAPIVSGVLADRRFGCVRLLQVGSGLYTLHAVMLFLILRFSVMCNYSLRNISDLMLAVASGFARPCLLALAYEVWLARFGSEPMLFCQLHYLCEIFGQVIGCTLAYLESLVQITNASLGVRLGIACIMLLLALFASGSERRSWKPNRFQVLPWFKVRRLIIVAVPQILLYTVILFGGFALNGWEITYYGSRMANQTLNISTLKSNLDLALLDIACSVFTCLLLFMLLTRIAPNVLGAGHQARRIVIGLSLGIVSQVCASGLEGGLAMASRAGRSFEVIHLWLMFGSVTVLSGAAAAITFTAMNEVALLVAPSAMRTYVIGLFTALWGTSFLLVVLVQFVSFKIADYNMVKYFESTIAWVYLILACTIACATVYFVRLAPRALEWLVQDQDEDRQQEETEAREELQQQQSELTELLGSERS